MADMLALSWDRRRLTGIELGPDKISPRIVGGFSVEWPEQPPTAAWLRETLKRSGINAKQVALALPREDAVLRMLELPDVPEDELPTLVRFQAAARSAQSLDQLLLDYLPLPPRVGVSQKEVWLATTLLTTVDPIRAMLQEAGVELTQLTLSSLCLTELIARGQSLRSIDPAAASLVVVRSGARMELAVVCQRQLIAAHAVKWSSVQEIPPVAKMLAEVSRVLVQVQAWLPEGTLQRAWVLGEDADVGDLPAAIGQRWNCPVERFDPRRDAGLELDSEKFPGAATDYAVAAGLAQILSGRLTPKIDLLHPRQPPPKRDPRKPYIVAASAAALFVAALGTGIVQQTLASYDAAIEELRQQDNNLSLELKAGEPTFAAAKDVDDWQAHNINQLKQMGELYQVMNGTERVIISEYKYGTSMGKSLAKIAATGLAKDRVAVERLAQNLADQPKFEVRPSQVNQSNRDHDYVNQFSVDMDVVPVAAKSAATGKSGAAPAPVSKTK